MKRLYLTMLAVICALQMMADYNVKDFGAKGDGTTLDSPAINAAIEEALKKADERPMVVLDDVMNDKLQNITGPNGKIIRKK